MAGYYPQPYPFYGQPNMAPAFGFYSYYQDLGQQPSQEVVIQPVNYNWPPYPPPVAPEVQYQQQSVSYSSPAPGAYYPGSSAPAMPGYVPPPMAPGSLSSAPFYPPTYYSGQPALPYPMGPEGQGAAPLPYPVQQGGDNSWWMPYPTSNQAPPYPAAGGLPYPTGPSPAGPYETQAFAGQVSATGAKQSEVFSGSSNVLPSGGYKDQRPTRSYADVRAECSRSRRLWEDTDFPANNYSISTFRQPRRQIEWKRPHEIARNPKFIEEGISRFDVVQGELGDCWVLAAVANLTLNDELMRRVVPHSQTFDKPDYCGVFRFQFWSYGEWQEVIVDDRLPTYNGRLLYMHSDSNTEFWSALLEKAYAKLVGCYDNLRGGSTSESMTDLSGGFCEVFELKEKTPKGLLQILKKGFERGSLMCCSINQRSNMETMAKLANGLIMGHAYSVTDIKTVRIRNDMVDLVRVRNPWGQSEWNGAFSDNSSQWQQILEQERQRIGLVFDTDGEFWMTYRDFISNFEELEMCNLSLDFGDIADDFSRMSVGPTMAMRKAARKWETTIIHGEWKRHFNAGGCRNYLQTFATNPQYRIKITDPDDQDNDDLCTVLIGLLQKDRRRQKFQTPNFLTVGFSVYKLNDRSCDSPLDQAFFQRNVSVARTTYINTREVSGRFRLPPGTYAVIPTTFEPNVDGDYVLRIYSEKQCTAERFPVPYGR